MVLPLQKLCLAALRDSLKDRPNPVLYEIPPPNHRQSLRQDLLDLVLASAVIIQESAYVSLSSAYFLDGFSKFSTQRGITCDREFLDRVADSFSHVQRNGKTIGEGITDLKLNVYVYGYELFALNLDSAVRVISQCPNLKVLHLDFICDKLGHRRWGDENLLAGLPALLPEDSSGGLLNLPVLAPCLVVLENVEELSLSAADLGWRCPSLVEKCPTFKFNRLTSLHLTDFLVDKESWKELLMTVKNSLIVLEAPGLQGVNYRGYRSGAESDSDVDSEAEFYMNNNKDWIMPFPLPYLRSFKMDTGVDPLTCQLTKTLMECPNLETVKIAISAGGEREDAMRLLNQMNVSLEVGIVLENPHPDDESSFQWVSLFKEKIKKMRFRISQWMPQHSAALKNLFVSCPDLVDISFDPMPPFPFNVRVNEDEDEDGGEETDDADVLHNRLMATINSYSNNSVLHNPLMATVNSDLAPFLRDAAVVSKLRKLELFGPFDHAVLEALFENAANLESLKMKNCPQLSDSHLQLWASCGAQPEYLELVNCDNITDHGLVPVLVSSGQRLKYFKMHDDRMDRIGMSAWRTLFDQCPFFDCPPYLSEQLMEFLGSQCPDYLRS